MELKKSNPTSDWSDERYDDTKLLIYKDNTIKDRYYIQKTNPSGSGSYYYRDGDVGKYTSNLSTATLVEVWYNDNNVISMGYKVEGGSLYDADGNLLGVLTSVGEDLYTTSVPGMEYLVNRNGTWHKAYSDGEIMIEVASNLVSVFAGIKVADFASGDFVSIITDNVVQNVYVGEFFGKTDSGVFNLFTDEELDNILVKDFSQACTDKVKGATIIDLANAGIISIRDGLGNLTGVYSLFTEEELASTTIVNFTASVTAKTSTTTVGKLVDAGLIGVNADNITKLNTLVPTWRNMTVDQLLNEILG